MMNLIYALRVAFSRNTLVRSAKYLTRYPGASIDVSANCTIVGKFEYGNNCRIADGANLIVPERAALRVGDDCYIGRFVELGPSGTITVGDRTSIQDRSILVGDVTVGRNCLLSLNVLMTSGTHYFAKWPHLPIRDQDNLVSASPEGKAQHSRPIIVGEDCWIGMNAVVMPGVTIERGCVVGANAVVTKDLPAYSVVAGTPARELTRRLNFSPPSQISWQVDTDIPYFYSGFQTSADERAANSHFGGHVAAGAFSIWLSGEMPSIVVRARSIAEETAICGPSNTIILNDQWQDIAFERAEVQQSTSFGISGRPIVVASARVSQ